MADHTGYIFVAPNGMYLSIANCFCDNNPPKPIFRLTVYLDCAHLFPTYKLPTNPVGYGQVLNALKKMGFSDNNEELFERLTPIAARSIQRIEIGDFTDDT
jgi:hypothetical protein